MQSRMFKFRLYPSKKQIKKLEAQLELCRQTHNWLLASCKGTYEETGKTLTQFDLNKNLTALKHQKPEINHVHSQVLQNISKRIKDAYTGFFARQKVGLKAGLPRFKKYGRYKSITYPQSGFKIKGKKLYLSKIGDIRVKRHRELQGQIKTLTVKRIPSGKWYACFSCIIETQSRDKPFEDIGIDVGLNSYVVLSNGEHVEKPQFYRNSEKRLGLLQKRFSKTKKGSNNRNKARIKVARLHEYIQNSRTNFLHKASRQIADTYETVYVEDLQVSNMVKNHCLAKSISDAGWDRFLNMIAYKAESAGGRLVKVNPRNTTQNCSRCGEHVDKSLSDRVHLCSYCGLVLNRDHNAALNILARGREIRREPPDFKPVEEKTSTLETMQVYPVNQEASLLVGR